MALDCGHEPSAHMPSTTGYGKDSDGRTFCYDCCAERERASMVETGRATLYLIDSRGDEPKPWEVTDWPGMLRFTVKHVRTGRHNIAGKRYDAWFNGPDGHEWHGTQFGDNTQIIHCKRTKQAC